MWLGVTSMILHYRLWTDTPRIHLLYFNFVLFSSFPQWLGPKLKRHHSDSAFQDLNDVRSLSLLLDGEVELPVGLSWLCVVWGLGVAELQWFNMYPSSKYGWKCDIESWKVSWMRQSMDLFQVAYVKLVSIYWCMRDYRRSHPCEISYG